MKKLYTAFLITISFAAQAQIMNNGDFKPDTTVSFSIAETKLNVGNSGQNQNWDFSKVTFIDTAVSKRFIPTSSTPGFSSFPTANLASNAIRLLPNGGLEEDSIIGYLYHNSTRADLLGYYSQEENGNSIGKYTPPMKISVTPFAYNEELNYLVDFKVTSSMSGAEAPYHVQKGSGKWKKDATGKAFFPTKNMAAEVSRFKNTEELFDTIITTTGDVEYRVYVHTTSINYFISNNKSDESMGISYDKYINTTWLKVGQGAPEIETGTEYDTSVIYERNTTLNELKVLATGVDNQQEALNVLTAFPVPSNGVVSLNFNHIEYVEISDAKGIFVERQKYEGTISLPANTGLYFIKAILPDGRSKNLKVVKE